MVLIFRICGHVREVWEPSVTGKSFLLPPTRPICLCWVGAGEWVAATHCVQRIMECASEWCFCSQMWAEEGGGIPVCVCSRIQGTPWVYSSDRAKRLLGQSQTSQSLDITEVTVAAAALGTDLPERAAGFWGGQLLMSWALPWASKELLTQTQLPVSQALEHSVNVPLN